MTPPGFRRGVYAGYPLSIHRLVLLLGVFAVLVLHQSESVVNVADHVSSTTDRDSHPIDLPIAALHTT